MSTGTPAAQSPYFWAPVPAHILLPTVISLKHKSDYVFHLSISGLKAMCKLPPPLPCSFLSHLLLLPQRDSVYTGVFLAQTLTPLPVFFVPSVLHVTGHDPLITQNPFQIAPSLGSPPHPK
jgi:hypothetical protein